MSTSTVGELSALPADATRPTEDTTPAVVLLSGSVIVTLSPALTSDCCAASSATVTWWRVELTPSTGPACTAAPRVGCTVFTRTGPDLNTTDPRGRSPVCASP